MRNKKLYSFRLDQEVMYQFHKYAGKRKKSELVEQLIEQFLKLRVCPFCKQKIKRYKKQT